MTKDPPCKTSPDLEYPCDWAYRIIGSDEASLRQLIAELLGNREHRLVVSNRSAKGRYTSLRLELTVGSDEDRKGIFEALSGHDAVKIVL